MLARLAPDDELLAAYVQGNEVAFETLYKRYRRRLWGLAKKMAWDLQQAEDILVEAMAAVAVQARRGARLGGHALTITDVMVELNLLKRVGDETRWTAESLTALFHQEGAGAHA
mgnify:CR=1 FL=1